MTLCTSCRLALRRTLASNPRTPQHTTTRSLATKSLAASILSKPSWSVRSLLPSSSSSSSSSSPAARPETISSTQLHHLLRLSALPLPSTPEAESAMMATLQSQLQFVRAVQRVNTIGIEPLRAIRDETPEARAQNTIGLADLEDFLARETPVGHYRRPKRVRTKIESEAEKWDALATASRKAGRHFVVRSAKGQTAEGSD